ncbi:hypothetical protein WJX72_010816 [[Myrmecia] bisecta]|uniref:DUF4460 domain-containing protein n=1 Tax=[Myrmecia] bisecta TaxID=41462 RepID=A0AAW1Q4C7_9CHLO
MNADEKKFIKAVVRRVHPDLFAAHPFERNRNSESLKLLNNYVDELTRGGFTSSASVEFWVKEDGGLLTKIQAELPAYGSLGPLFYAFGLISSEELRSGIGTYERGEDNRSFLHWLSETVAEAVRTADQHELLKKDIRGLRASIEDRFTLAAIQVGGEFAVSTAEQKRQIEALKVLDTCLMALCADLPLMFEGLNIRLYHPYSCPFDTYEFLDDDGGFNTRTGLMQSYVADDGCLHIVADRAHIQEAVISLDLERARILTRLSLFWVRRVRDLTPPLKELLGVDHVWCDSRTEQSSQKFVLWAGSILEHRYDFEAALYGQRFSFSVLVHSDTSSPMVDFLSSSSVLQVRSDCPPARLLEFMCSESGDAANQAAQAVQCTNAEEEELLERVRAALNAKHVIRVCSSYEQDKVMQAAHRLLENADAIRAAVDLSGASIAIDDCYELWDSGFISIPYDFRVQELQPELQKLLGSHAPSDCAHTHPSQDGRDRADDPEDLPGGSHLHEGHHSAAAEAHHVAMEAAYRYAEGLDQQGGVFRPAATDGMGAGPMHGSAAASAQYDDHILRDVGSFATHAAAGSPAQSGYSGSEFDKEYDPYGTYEPDPQIDVHSLGASKSSSGRRGFSTHGAYNQSPGRVVGYATILARQRVIILGPVIL